MFKITSLLKRILKIKKIFLVLLIIGILASIFIVVKTRGNKQPLQFAKVQRKDLKQQVSASGIVEGSSSATLRFPSSGNLAFIYVQKGDEVTKDQVLAGLDRTSLLSNLEQSQNNLRSAQANLEKTLDDIHLFQYGNGGFSNMGSANETQAQRQQRMNAESARDNAVEAIKSAQDALSNATLFAPISGVVTNTPPVAGQTVGAADTIIQISDLSQKEFDADVDESDISRVKPGQRGEFTLNAYGDKIFSGYVFSIDPITHTNSSGETVVTVKISADNSQIQSIAGLNGQVNIITDQKNNVLSIPNDAIKSDNTVYVKSGKKVEAKKIQILFQSDSDSQIEGLNEGDEVVVNPQVVKI